MLRMHLIRKQKKKKTTTMGYLVNDLANLWEFLFMVISFVVCHRVFWLVSRKLVNRCMKEKRVTQNRDTITSLVYYKPFLLFLSCFVSALPSYQISYNKIEVVYGVVVWVQKMPYQKYVLM